MPRTEASYTSFEEALERLDLDITDIGDMENLAAYLQGLLGQFNVSDLQLEKAAQYLGTQQQRLFDAGFIVDRFTRAGRSVTATRDRFGRFVGRASALLSRQFPERRIR